MRNLSIAVWRKSPRRDDPAADVLNAPEDIADIAAGSGRLALDLVDSFLASREWTIDALEWTDEGEIAGLLPVEIPVTVWLRERDLAREHWERLGRGPRITFVDADDDRVAPEIT